MFGWRRGLMQAGMLLAGGLFLLIAALLLAVAGWLWLASVAGAVWASVIVAASCLVLGLGGPRRRPRRDPARDEAALRAVFAELGLEMPPPGGRPPLLQAFLFGLATARSLGRDRRR
jgi:hypothetical protein